eukprot:CAMPEP_0174915806 /NCGR_PEP_ID=MMETSP1355-20121228/1377_1 /TAXON_ID=464990 /ORGANISM="Hemiselmis tepida, Strain CCMP443" /LENGTH=53 /DNA_ID=CAMNT_0016160747 /DNA_START=22 /DNA_END=183 /DNA_ORIENTATION=-
MPAWSYRLSEPDAVLKDSWQYFVAAAEDEDRIWAVRGLFLKRATSYSMFASLL